jgi:D-3-phosphoglycerate dehydrogenase / 2-oxoglutarate reductase
MTVPFRVLVTSTDLVPEAVARLEAAGAAVVMLDGRITEDRLLAAFAEAPVHAVLMRGNPPFTEAVFARAPHLRVVAKHGAGVDSVDIAAATRHGVLVMVAGDANAPAVAEHTMALILALGRDIVTLDARTRGGAWDREGYKGRELRGRTLGLVGFGRIARRVAVLGRCFGMDVLALPRVPGSIGSALAEEAASLPALLAASDVVSLHAPLTAATRGMINRTTLALMKPDALLVNTARGGLIDEAALAEALEAGRLAGAGLDNLADEPPAPDCPLLRAPRLIVTPHIAGITTAAMIRMGTVAAENIAAVLEGRVPEPGNVLNPAARATATTKPTA